MTQKEKRLFLIHYLLTEVSQDKEPAIPAKEEAQKQLLRSLMNIRPPRPVSPEFLQVQDAYLKEDVRRKGIVAGKSLSASGRDGRLALWKGDITTLKVDAIVNASNSALKGCYIPCHSCVDNIIHSISGVQLRLSCDEIIKKQGYEEPTGRAKITPAFNLPSKYVLHTVGPIISGALTNRDCQQLADCYRSCLELAAANQCRSIAFCCISTGEFHFPQDKAAEIAVQTVTAFLKEDRQVEQVVFNVFKQEDYEIYRELL